MIKSLRAVIGGLSSIDEASVCRFDMMFYPGEGFTGSADKLLAGLKEAANHRRSSPSVHAGLVPLGNHGDSRCHKVEVWTTRGGVVAETRGGYYSGGEKAAQE